MLPEKNAGIEVLKNYQEDGHATPLGGDSTILPKYNRKGEIESYEVKIDADNGGQKSFIISKQQGQNLIEARIAKLASSVDQFQIVSDEAVQSLLPTYIAEEYRKRLRMMGVPEDQIPQSTIEMVERAKTELVAYRELGREQIATAAQHVADQFLEIIGQVLSGDKTIYDELPKPFQNVVNFHLDSLSALAAQHSGINEETLAAQQLALKINLLGHEKTREAILDWLPAIAGASADTIATFFGNLIGTTGGAVAVSYEKAKEAVKNKKRLK